MKLPKLSTFPLHKPFEREAPTTPLSECGLRLVADFYSDSPRVLGTAAVLSGHLVITAKHVLADLNTNAAPSDGIQLDHHIVAVQVLPGPEYIVWNVMRGLFDPTCDLALLQLTGNPGRSHPDKPIAWRQPRVNPFPPNVGERVVAFGYRQSVVSTSPNDKGGFHIDLNDEPMTSVGEVREIHESRRDTLLPFPCYQVSARFDGGMSGGPVFEETGALCGIVCSNIAGSHIDGEPVSYVSSLWPIFRLGMDFERGGGWPKGQYFGIDLARANLIKVVDIDRLNQLFVKHIDGPPFD